MLPAFKALEGCDYGAVRRNLLDTGYTQLGNGKSGGGSIFRRGDDPFVIRLYSRPDVPEALVAMADKCPGNPFLPRVDDRGVISLSRKAHVLVTEALEHPAAIAGPLRVTMTGQADSFANFPLGDIKHIPVHAIFARCSKAANLSQTMNAIADAVLESVGLEGDDCLRLNRSTSPVMFRRKGPGYEPVFVNPLRVHTDLQDAKAEAMRIKHRCDTLLNPADARPARPASVDAPVPRPSAQFVPC